MIICVYLIFKNMELICLHLSIIKMNSSKNNLIDIINTGNYYIIKVTLGTITIQKYRSIQEKMKKISDQALMFDDFVGRGACQQITFSFQRSTNIMKVKIDKNYFNYVLNQRQYELLIISKHMLHVWDEFLDHANNFVKYVEDNKSFIKPNEIVSIDLISITIKKKFQIKNVQNSTIYRTIFLRQSSFEFKKNLSYYRSKQSDHLFSFTQHNDEESLPSPQAFYLKPRLNFIDDLHSSQSLLKRFTQRFMTFYIPFCLANGDCEPNSPQVRQFYRRVYGNSYFYAVRLKKFGFIFPIKRMVKDGSEPKIKTTKLSLYFYFHDKQNEKPEVYYPQNVSKNLNENFSYFLEALFPDLSEKIANQTFCNKLGEKKYFEVQRERNRANIYPRNEESYCKVLCQFSFLLDRLFLLLMEQNKDSKRKNIEDPKELFNKLALEDESLMLKLPLTESYSIKKSKYLHQYQIQIKNTRLSLLEEKQTANRDPFIYKNELHEIKIYRKKITDQQSPVEFMNDFLSRQLSGGNHPLGKGLRQYINRVMSSWNLRDVYQQISDFTGAMMEIAIDKINEKITVKNYGGWNHIIGGIDTFLLSLSQLFFSKTSAIKITILSEETDDTNNYQIQDNLLLAELTFSYYQLNRGWVEAIPPCVYLVRVYKTFIEVRMDEGQDRVKIPIESVKTAFKKKIKEFMQENNIYNITFPITL